MSREYSPFDTGLRIAGKAVNQPAIARQLLGDEALRRLLFGVMNYLACPRYAFPLTRARLAMNFERTIRYRLGIDALAVAGACFLAWSAGLEPFASWSGVFLLMLAMGGLESLFRLVVRIAVGACKPGLDGRKT